MTRNIALGRFLIVFLFVICFAGEALADVSGTSPSNGTCICVTSSFVNVRSSACGAEIGELLEGQCLRYAGSKETCSLDGVTYDFFELQNGSSTGWSAGPYLSTAYSCCQCPGGDDGVTLVSRSEWGARTQTSTTYIDQPVPRVFVHHTDTESCSSQSGCSYIARAIQGYHMDAFGWSDVGYNFLVGGDGRVYEGRGWDRVGAHTLGYNDVSIGIAVIGNYSDRAPNDEALEAVQRLIACGVSQDKLSSQYTLHGHRDGFCTECPGQAFYDIVVKWPHYGGKLAGSC